MNSLDHVAAPARAPDSFIATGAEVFHIEAEAVLAQAARLGPEFDAAVNLMLNCSGRIVVSGIGKSGHIGRKIAATLASTGTPAFFVHPAEASHGDLGMITKDDAVIALSYSGESDELVAIVPLIKRAGTKLICITGSPKSTLASQADVHLPVTVEREACPLNLAPTASTTVTLAMGDALAIALLKARGFGADDFARSHPGGKLGKRLLVRVSDVMHSGSALPQVSDQASLAAALIEMSEKGLGMTAIVDSAGQLQGVFTDGDLRRALEAGADLRSARIVDVMKRNPLTMPPEKLAVEAVRLMETRRINGLLVVDQNQRLVGALNMHDLFKAGVV